METDPPDHLSHPGGGASPQQQQEPEESAAVQGEEEQQQRPSGPAASSSASPSPSPSPVEHPSEIHVQIEEDDDAQAIEQEAESHFFDFTVQPEVEEPEGEEDVEYQASTVGSMAETVDEHQQRPQQEEGQPPFGSTQEEQRAQPLHIHGEPVHLPDDIPSISSPAAEAFEAHSPQTQPHASSAETQTLRDQLSASQAEVTRLQAALAAEPEKQRLAEVESDKRDLLALVSQLTSDKSDLADRQAQEAQARQTANDAVRELEASLAAQSDSERSARLKLQQAQSRVSILEQDRDWHKEELNKTTEAYQQFRSQSHSQLSSLQSRLELSQRNEASASTSLAALKTAHSSMERRLVDTLAKNAELTSKLVESQAAFKADIDASKRLTETLHKRDQQAQVRLEAVEQEWTEAREHIQSRETELLNELQEERLRADQAQAKMEELAQLVDGRHPAPAAADESSFMFSPSVITNNSAAPALTPARTNGAEATFSNLSTFLLSPAASLASRAQRASGAATNQTKSYSELYTTHIATQTELSAAQAECHRLSDCLAGVLADLEERAPLLAEQRSEAQRLREEQQRVGVDLAQALDDRDHEARRAEGLQLDLQAAQTENGLMARQLRDCGRQLRELLRVVADTQDADLFRREPDFDAEAYEAAAEQEDEVDTQAVITNQLVTYTSVSDLQRQNSVLLRLTREMGSKMDEQDRQLRARLESEGDASVAEAQQVLSQMRHQLSDIKSKLDAAHRERDMLKRALSGQSSQQQQQQQQQSTQKEDEDEDVVLVQREGRVASASSSGGAAAAAEVQASFDAYRAEVSQDLKQLRDELAAVQRSHRKAESEAARCQAQLDFAQERLRMASQTQDLSKAEAADLNRQIQRLQSNLAKQDHEVHQAQEQILSLKAERDRLSHDLSNIRAEREAWKRMEERLTSEQSRFSTERTELKDTIRHLQHEQQMNEKSVEQSRTSMEQHLARVDRHLEETKARLGQEVESNRELKLRSDLKGREAERKIERLNADLSHRQELLAVTRATQRHLEQRIIDLGTAIAAKDDKLGIYEGRLTGAGTAQDPTVPREQQLELELAHLRASLRAADLELKTGREQVDQFKASSQVSEGKVANAQKALDELKTKLEAEIAAKESEITSLRSRAEGLVTELETARSEVQSLQEQQGVAKTDVERQLAEAHSRLSEAQTETEKAQEAATWAQANLNTQLEAMRRLNSSYLVEQASHAEIQRRLETMSTELTKARQASLAAEQASQSHEVSLRLGKEAWENQRAALQRELDSSNERFEELKTQNTSLHQHLAALTEQTDKLRTSGEAPAQEEGDASELPKIVKYLRDQQELLDAQLTMERQEKARVTASLQHAEERLEETRSQLTQERLAVGNAATTSAQTEEMLSKVQELALLRESNETLRIESSKSAERAQSLADKCSQLESQLSPLREQVATLEADNETREGQIQLLQADNTRWKSRNEQVLVKYDRIDPQELQGLKDRVESLQLEKEAVSAQYHKANERFKGIQVTAKSQRDIIEEHKEKIEEYKKEISALRESADAASTGAAADLSAKSQEWETQREALEKAHIEALEETKKETITLKEQLSELQTQVASSSSSSSEIQEAKTALEAQVATLSQQLETEKQRAAELEQKVTSQPAQVVVDQDAVQAEVEKRLATLMPQGEAGSEGDAAPDIQQLLAAERTRAVEENNKKVEEEHQKALSTQTTAHETALEELRKQLETAKSEAASQSNKASTSVQNMQKQLRDALNKARSLEAQLADANQFKQQLQTVTAERDAARTHEQELAKQVEEQSAAIATNQSNGSSSGLTQEEVDRQAEQRVQQALLTAKEENTAAIAAAVKVAESEKETKLAAIKAQLNVARSTIASLKGKLAASSTPPAAAPGATPTATSAAAVPTTTTAAAPAVASPPANAAPPARVAPTSAFNIKGLGGSKPSDLPPLPGQKKKVAPQQAKASSNAAAAGTPSSQTPASPATPATVAVRGASPTARRGRGAGRGTGRGGGLLSSAIGAAVDQSSTGGAGTPGGAGVKRLREDGQDSGDESGQKRLRPAGAGAGRGGGG